MSVLAIDAQVQMGLKDNEVFAEGYYNYGTVRLWFSNGCLVRENKGQKGPPATIQSRTFSAEAVTDGVHRYVRSLTKPVLARFLERQFKWVLPLTPGL
jgi:hypothetical protein